MQFSSNSITGLFKYLWRYAGSNRRFVILFIAMSAIAMGVLLLKPLVMGNAFNIIQESEIYNRVVFNSLVAHLFVFFCIEVIFWAFHGISRVMEQEIAFKIKVAYKRHMLSMLMNLPLQWHKENHSGKSIDKINRAAEGLFMFSSNIFEYVGAVVQLIVAFSALLIINPFSGLISTVVAVAVIAFVVYVDIYISKLLKKQYRFDNKAASAVHDFVTNITTVISLKLQDYAEKEIVKRMMRSFPVFKKQRRTNEKKWAGVSLSVSAMIACIIGLYAYNVLQKEEMLLIGTVTIIYAYLREVAEVFYTTAWKYSMSVEHYAQIQEAENISNEFKKVASNKAQIEKPKDWKKIEVKNLSFIYKDAKRKKKGKKTGLFNVSLDIEKGKKIALVGTSGSGKSTAMSVLKGFYEPEKGQVAIDGKVKNDGFKTLSELVSYVPQDPEIFQNTVKYNIALAKKVSKRELQKVIKLSHFDEVLKRLKKDTSLNIAEKGVSLSGGEKQRLSLARGLMFSKDKDIILLDEPTSSIDARIELAIFKDILGEYKEKTIIASVHRLHLLNLFDEIYLFKKGKMVGRGTLKQLSRSNKYFRHIQKAYKEAENDDSLSFT